MVPMLLEIGSKLSALDQPRPCPRLLWQATQATLCSSLDGSGARAVAGPQSTKPVGTVKAVFIISLGPAVLFWIYFNKSGRPASSGLAAVLLSVAELSAETQSLGACCLDVRPELL